MDWDIDHPIKEHIAIAGDCVLHIYYYVSDDLAGTELEGLGEIEIDEKHIHLFLHEDGVYLLRTDGKAESSPKRNEGIAINFQPEIAEAVGTFIHGHTKGQLLPIMCAPLDIQFRWYDYLLERRAGNAND